MLPARKSLIGCPIQCQPARNVAQATMRACIHRFNLSHLATQDTQYITKHQKHCR